MQQKRACGDFQTYFEADHKILKIDLAACSFPPSIEYSELCMDIVMQTLLRTSGVTKVILSQLREYEYDQTQTGYLLELASLYHHLAQQEREKYSALIAHPPFEKYIRASYAKLQSLIELLKKDPLNAYIKLKRFEKVEKQKIATSVDPTQQEAQTQFLTLVDYALTQVEQLAIIKILLPHTTTEHVGSRELYGLIFAPTTRPDFMYTKLVTQYPQGNLEESYSFTSQEDVSQVNVFSFDDDIKTFYQLIPPEYTFEQELYELLDDAKRIMAEHKPTREEFVNPQRMREVFFSIGKDLLTDLVRHKQLQVDEHTIHMLARALLRYTVGFGLVELLLADPKVQDVNINAPNGSLPIFLVHEDYGDCYTNVYPTHEEVQSWATKLRLISGRPLDEANPILDTELKIKGFSSRVAAISAPLSPNGLAFSFRRHRDFPWTFPLYMSPKIRYMDATAAGLLSFLIDNNATILVAGTRSSGKSSLLGSFLVEMKRSSRILTIEDTFELPQESLREFGYNIESLKVASALSSPGSEVDPSVGIRSTLRLGDSAIFVGEVRSKEAIALFEAMRVGAAANVVAGTIHADSPYGVFDRVVNDIGVPKTSFKAIDIIVVTNPVISGLKKYKRVLKITEVRKTWDNDPLSEGAFVDLMVYNPTTDQLEVTDELINGNSEILKRMAGKVKEFAGDWEAVWKNIQLRSQLKQMITDAGSKNKALLEAQFVIKANDQFHLLAAKHVDNLGKVDNKKVLFFFKEWLEKERKRLEASS